MHLSRVAILGVVAGLVITAPAALAAPIATSRLQLSTATHKRVECGTTVASGRSVTRRALVAPLSGAVSLRLQGAKGSDWDVAVLDRTTKRVINGAVSPNADEVLTALVTKGQKLAVQACRQRGKGGATLTVGWLKIRTEPQQGATRMARVDMRPAFAQERLAALGLDTADHPTPDHWDVVLYGDGDEAKLRASGLAYRIVVADLAARDRADRRADRRASRPGARSLKQAAAMPSGRTSYRTLPEINQELTDLAAAHPDLVRLFELPGRSLEGRPILGIEIAKGVKAPDDGRPVYVQVGTHHAREWPANEATLEFGYQLINGYGTDPRATAIVDRARTYVIPVLNVDGFDTTIQAEGLAPGGNYADPNPSGGASGSQANGSGAYKRKNCRPADPAVPVVPGACLARAFGPGPLPDEGVDLNRNYPVEWGGPGSNTDPSSLTYHGPSAASEPETQAMMAFLRARQPAVLITNHTFAGLILRPPGTNKSGPVPDEQRLRGIGDRFALQTGYLSQFSYQLYDTTGTTDDYVYDGLGGFSYTPEIGTPAFHSAYSTVIDQYDGIPELDPYGDPTGRIRGGLREAYLEVGEAVIGADKDAAGRPLPPIWGLITGSAPAGRTLRITKPFSYRTSDRPDDDAVQYPVQTINETRSSTMVVPAGGTYAWHVNPSRQPRSPDPVPWRLTCEDGAGNVLETRDVYVERSQTVNLDLACGQGSGPGNPQPVGQCTAPAAFKSVDVARRSRGRLRISFTRNAGAGRVSVAVFQTSKGRKVIGERRVRRYTGRTSSFTWNGRSGKGKRLTNGVYFVRFRARDAAGRLDSRRVVVQRKHARFAKQGGFYLVDRCER